ncbi:MAG: hypothetical protein GEV12_11325 [Micromonosporaceae bacterium]|nr:hypothetical protein [Micromonosporaceae bacterium]
MVTAMLVVAHAGVAALWLGAMAYSLVVVQPRLARMLTDPARVEDAQRELARGNRWPVLGLIGVLWLTGIGLVATGTGGGGGWWWAAVAGKAALLAAATGVFWWVSWRAWPRRVFALPAELPVLQRRFRAAALAMLALVGAGFVLGAVAGS